MSLVLERHDGESWADAATRLAKPYGLEREIGDEFTRRVADGWTEPDAAWAACYEWDVLDFREDP